MASVTVAVDEQGRARRGIAAETMRRLRLLSFALLLVTSGAARAEDTYYPEYRRNPVPPVVVIEDIALQDEPVFPACNPANEGCDDPEGAAGAVASRIDREPPPGVARLDPSSPLARRD